MRDRPALWLFGLALCMIPASLPAQSVETDLVRLTVTEARFRSITDGSLFRVKVENRSNETALVFRDLSLELPAELGHGEKHLFGGEAGASFDLALGAWKEESVVTGPVSLWAKPSLLFFRSGNLPPAFISVEYTQPGGEDRLPISVTVPLDPAPTILSVLLGGAVGVFIVPIFRELWRRYQRLPPQPDRPPFIIALLLGWLTTGVVILILRFSETELPALPLAVHVKDLYGGVLVGLLFEPLARWLAGFLRRQRGAEDGAGA